MKTVFMLLLAAVCLVGSVVVIAAGGVMIYYDGVEGLANGSMVFVGGLCAFATSAAIAAHAINGERE